MRPKQYFENRVKTFYNTSKPKDTRYSTTYKMLDDRGAVHKVIVPNDGSSAYAESFQRMVRAFAELDHECGPTRSIEEILIGYIYQLDQAAVYEEKKK